MSMEQAPPDGRSLDVLSRGSAGPDQLVAILAFDFGEGCVDRSREARVVQLDREVVASIRSSFKLANRRRMRAMFSDASLFSGNFAAFA